jgi:hypothetical protein
MLMSKFSDGVAKHLSRSFLLMRKGLVRANKNILSFAILERGRENAAESI